MQPIHKNTPATRTAFTVGLCVALLAGTAWGRSQSPARLFAQVLPRIRARTRIPILVPAWLPPDSSPRYPTATASRHEYFVELADTPDCNGAMSCLDTTVSGEDGVAVADDARRSGQTVAQSLRQNSLSGVRRVSLPGGVTGFYTVPGPATADGGSTTLSWRYRGCYYQVQARGIIPLVTMTHCAASAIP